MPENSSELVGTFGVIDWAVVLALLAFTTWVGHRLSGPQASLRDFFLGGRKLPWYAVSASIIATEISAVTYISLPSVVFKSGGNLTYLQLGVIGSLCARALIAWLLVPKYYEREILSPYEYMAARLGSRMRSVTTVIFSLGGVLGQSARVYLTAVVLQVILHRELGWVEVQTGLPPLVSAVTAIGTVAVLWTWMGGIATVVWTDAILFLLFLVGVAIAVTTVSFGIDGGVSEAMEMGRDADKFRFFDFDPDPTKTYTFWVALIAITWSGVGSYGTDQLIAQRLFCCKSAREARLAILGSYAAVVVIFLVGIVGIALFAWYRVHPLEGAALAMFEERPDRIFPIFIVEVIPAGLKGLVLAGAFAAAISSLDSILAALSQTSLSALWLRGAEENEQSGRRLLRISRVLVLFWAVVLCAAAVGCEKLAASYHSILDLALGVAGYTGGALIAGFALAFLPGRRDASGYSWSAPMSIVAVFAVSSHQAWGTALRAAGWWCAPETLAALFGIVCLGLWSIFRRGEWGKMLLLAAGLLALWATARWGYFPRGIDETGATIRGVLAFPWWMPLGSLVAFLFGLLLLRPGARREE
jgi:solute:Na+ symporter, SSS family